MTESYCWIAEWPYCWMTEWHYCWMTEWHYCWIAEWHYCWIAEWHYCWMAEGLSSWLEWCLHGSRWLDRSSTCSGSLRLLLQSNFTDFTILANFKNDVVNTCKVVLSVEID